MNKMHEAITLTLIGLLLAGLMLALVGERVAGSVMMLVSLGGMLVMLTIGVDDEH